MADESRMRLMEPENDEATLGTVVARAYTRDSSARKVLSSCQGQIVPILVGLVALFMMCSIGLALRLPCALWLPNGPYSCQKSVQFECSSILAVQAPVHAVQDGTTSWTFQTARDERNYALTHDQCEAAFPGLFTEVDKAVQQHQAGAERITSRLLDEQNWRPGTVRAMVYDRELFLIQANEGFGHRMHATMHSLNRALATAPEWLPNVEFVMNDADYLDPALPYWAYTRKPDWNNTWLIPDFGFYSWPEPGIGTYQEVRRRMRESADAQTSFKDKIQKAFWRGNVRMGEGLRSELMRVTKNKPWADVSDLQWNDREALRKEYVSITDHCKYAILVHTEGESYSGRLKYLQNCPSSLIFMHALQWIQPFEYLLVSSGPQQNYVEIARDFSDLEEKVLYFLDHPEEAERIISNSLRVFRDRYITPAATPCYWRRLIKGWAEVSEPPVFYKDPVSDKDWRGVPFESASLMGTLHWEIH